jgi:hypothetical protein
MREIFAAQVAPALAGALGQELAAQRAGLVSAQLLGLGLTRYLLRIPAVTALSPQESKIPSLPPSGPSSNAAYGPSQQQWQS